MSRLVGSGFLLCDATATVASALSGWDGVGLFAVTLVSSIGFALMSQTVRSLLWPSYFWDAVDSP